MKKSSLTVLAILTSWLTAVAQESTKANDKSDTIINLSPFEVKSTKDTSYGATNSLTATRIATAIKDTPLAISVITADFLNDTGSTNSFTDSFRYVPSIVPDSRSEGEASGIFGSVIGYARGFPLDAIMRNGISRAGAFSLRNVERVEFLKGPVSVFYGASQPGGTVNYITKIPSMNTFTKLSTGLRSYELSGHSTEQQHASGLEFTYENEGIFGKKIGYRVYNYIANGRGWRDNEYKREWNFTPSLLWRPSDRLEVLVEFEHSRTDSNPAAQTSALNPQYIADYSNPPADVMSKYNLTVASYRALMFGSSANWMNRTLATRGNTADVALAGNIFRVSSVGEGSYPGMFYDAASFSWQAAGHYNDSESNTFTVDLKATPADWLKVRYASVYNDWTRKWIQSFRSETNGDLTFNEASGGGDWTVTQDWRHQLDLVSEWSMLGFKNKVLIGGEYSFKKIPTRLALFDYNNNFVPIPGRGGVTLTGLNAWRLWDPVLSPSVPDQSVAFTGWANASTTELTTSAVYAAWQGNLKVGERSVLPSLGYRYEDLKTDSVSSAKIAAPTRKTHGHAITAGVVMEITQTVNAFASYNLNYKPQVGVLATGPGVNRDTKGNLVSGLHEDDAAENQQGAGADIGLKMATPDGKLSATLNWFRVERDKLLAVDRAKMQADSRNTPGTFYPNPAPSGPLQLVDGIGFNAINFYSNAGLQRNEGIEFETNYSANKRWDIVAGLAYTYTSKLVKDPSLLEPTKSLLLGKRLPVTPEWKYSVWVRHRFSDPAFPGWTLGAGFRGQTSANARYNAADTPELLKGFYVADINLDYAFDIKGKRWHTSLSVANLTDKLYITGAFAYAEPRTLSLRLETKF